MMMSALLLTALAGAGMLRALEGRTKQDVEARAHAAGAVFAQWFRAAHHVTQSEEEHYRTLVASQGGALFPGDALRSAGLVPDWLPARTDAGQTIALGVLDDGRGVPMAFALASPTRPLSALHLESFVAGAAANRVGDVGGPGRTARSTRWRGAMERVLGRPLERGELYATADAGIAHDRRVVYRREQPGRVGQSRMETALVFGSDAGISDVGDLDARRAELAEGLTVGTLRAGGGLVAQRARARGEVRAPSAEGHDVTVNDSLTSSLWNAGTVDANSVVIEAQLGASGGTASGAVTAPGNLMIDRSLDVTAMGSPKTASERLDAWGAPGRVAASAGVEALYSVGERAVFDGRVTVTGACAGC